MQCRMNDIVVNDVPKFLTLNPTDQTHAMIARPDDDPDTVVTLPLQLKGVTSFLPVSRPTLADWDSQNYPRITLTSEHLPWDPSDAEFSNQEDRMTNHNGELIYRDPFDTHSPLIIAALSSDSTPLADITNDDNLGNVLESHVQVSAVHSGTVSSKQGKPVDAQQLAKRCNIPLDRARHTIRRTTQRGVRTVAHPTLSRRFPTNDRMLRYSRLPHDLFTDTKIAGIKSARQRKYAQVFATDYGWTRAYTIKHEREAHEALSTLFKKEGVPPHMISDNSNAQTKGEFRRKLREAGCHPVQLEPYSQWGNAAESAIRELKRASSRSMIRSGSPKSLWCYNFELTARIRSCTALDIFSLDGEVPETKLKGHTADISNICEYDWYGFIMYSDNIAKYPDDRWKLGRYLGPAEDVGSAMCYWILRENGEVIPRSTIRGLTEEELLDPVQTAARNSFNRITVKGGEMIVAK